MADPRDEKEPLPPTVFTAKPRQTRFSRRRGLREIYEDAEVATESEREHREPTADAA